MNFAQQLIEKMWGNIFSVDWLADQALGWAIFSVVAGLISGKLSEILESRRARRERQPFEGWSLQIIGYGDAPQSLFWTDVRSFLESEFELWKFVKSVASGTCFLKVHTVTNALSTGWVCLDRQARKITVNFEQIPPNMVDWQRNAPPEKWIGHTDETLPA